MQPIYLDYNSTTPVRQEVIDAMLPCFRTHYGNASSSTHAYGWAAAALVEKAREEVAALLGAESGEITFTSGATEAINLAMRGTMAAYRDKGRHMVIATTEHKAVIDTALDLERNGCSISWLQVNREGLIEMEELRGLLRPDTVLAAVMMANNETGVVQNVEAIGRLCLEKEVLFLCDTTQAAGKLHVDVKAMHMAMAVISAHKLEGPKGIGALWLSRKSPRVVPEAQITGGGHEKGLRAGTLAVPLIVGLGKAAALAREELWTYGTHTSRLRTILEQELTVDKPAYINGSIRNRLPNTSNICFNGLRAEWLLKGLPELALSMGSACSSALPQPSHVLKAMGLNDKEVYASVRFSLGRETTDAEIMTAIHLFEKYASGIG
jgi:cysteine desulfurase